MALSVVPPSQVETLVQEKRVVEHDEPAFRYSWFDSGDYTQLILKWQLRPQMSMLSQVFVDEVRRRQGLRAYGVRVGAKRRSRINQNHSNVLQLQPRALDVAKPSDA